MRAGVLRLVGERPARDQGGSVRGDHAHGMFLRLIERLDPDLSSVLHGSTTTKPFTVGVLTDGQSRTPQTAAWAVRLTALDDSSFDLLTRHLLAGGLRVPVQLGNAGLQISEFVTAASVSPWAGETSFEKIWDDARREPRFSIEFASPTAFSGGQREHGRRIELFPTADLVFGSLLSRWNRFAPRPVDPGLRVLAHERVVVAEYRLQSEALQLGGHIQKGFIGSVTYEVIGKPGPDELRALNALADFAFYAGVGYKTTMGMGQARRVDPWPKWRHRGR